MNRNATHESQLQVCAACRDLDAELDFWTGTVGMQLREIYPADSPRTAVVEGHGLRLRLQVQPDSHDSLRELELLSDDPGWDRFRSTGMASPGGVRVHLRPRQPVLSQPPTRQATVLTRADASAHWEVGRAGMRYRDLLPQRHGGAFIASHIRIVEGGPLPDYVHHHAIRFQMIFCRTGWVRVVYEGQGEPFLMEPGDCVLQPPHIRHRVLESSPGAEVVEIVTPAEHVTLTDSRMPLPSSHRLPSDHLFGGQRFVRHQASHKEWEPWQSSGFDAQDTGIAVATQGLADVRTLRPNDRWNDGVAQQQDAEFCLYYVLQGRMEVRIDDVSHVLEADDCLTLASGQRYTLLPAGDDLRLLAVTLPARGAPRSCN